MSGDDIHFVDTTFRDGSQSLWASNMRYGMMEPIASDMDAAGFDVIELPLNGILMKKIIRDLKENPFDMLRMFSAKMSKTTKACMGTISASGGFGGTVPRVVQRLAFQMTADIVSPYRVQTVCNTADQLEKGLATQIPMFHELGFKVCVGVSYSLSPRHTDELFREKTVGAVALRPDSIYLKDQGGLLTVDRARTLLPMMLAEAGDIPVELHSHCTTGLAPSVYAEAMKLGVRTLHCGVPPASDGSAQPSVLDTARNARALGFNPLIDEDLVRSISTRLTDLVTAGGLPVGEPLRYDEAQFQHQIPGGVIANLRFQLDAINLGHRIEEVKAESIAIREELGYPIMITPYSQHVVTQAAIHVATGKRWETVIDELIRFAQGAYGIDSGYTWMNQDLRDRILEMPRAREIKERPTLADEDLTLREAKELYGTADMSDEELIMRAIMQGSEEVSAMHRAGPPRRFTSSDTPLLRLLTELDRHPSIRFVSVQRGSDSFYVANRGSATPS